MDIIGGIAAAGEAIGIAKGLREVEKSYDAATYKAKLAGLIEALSDAKLALVEAKESLAAKDAEIVSLKEAHTVREGLKRGDDDYLFFTEPNGELSGYPACPKCLEDNRVVQMKRDVRVDSGKCPRCDTSFRPVTCYVPASENDGVATTKLAMHNERTRQAQEKTARRWAELNEDTWLSARYR